MNRKTPDPFVVTKETCGDCLYFGYVTGDTGRMWSCDYTFKTRKLRPAGETCAYCSVRIIKTKEIANNAGE